MNFPTTAELTTAVSDALSSIGVDLPAGDVEVRTPITGGVIARVRAATPEDVQTAVAAAKAAFPAWRDTPAPVRGRLVKRWGELLTAHKNDLATLVTAEVGKIASEALGEVQEMIDIADLAVGQSRQLFGKTMPSERPGHRLAETWHPLGVVGIISAFNFPVAVYAWNTALALVAGDTVVWKPAEATPLTALATDALLARAARDVGAPEGLHHVVLGGREVGARLAADERVALVSATGSVRMGQALAPVVAARFGRVLLELGGNNAVVVTPSADLDLALRGIVFASAGTAGQRCTTLRRLIVHRSLVDELVPRIAAAFENLTIGSPTEEGVLVGPLIDQRAFDAAQASLTQALAEGGEVVGGERVLSTEQPDAYYLRPAVVRMPGQTEVVHRETFAPILYVLSYDTMAEAIALHNAVPQGLSSAIFTTDQAEAERFTRPPAPTAGSST